jgi:hypothetical protein
MQLRGLSQVDPGLAGDADLPLALGGTRCRPLLDRLEEFLSGAPQAPGRDRVPATVGRRHSRPSRRCRERSSPANSFAARSTHDPVGDE